MFSFGTPRGLRHRPSRGLKVKQLIHIIMAALLLSWMFYYWHKRPKLGKGMDPHSGKSALGHVVVEGAGDTWDEVDGDTPGAFEVVAGSLVAAAAKKAADFANAGIVGRIAAKGGFRNPPGAAGVPLKLKDLVDPRVQGGGNLLGERGVGEEEVGKRKWDEVGEGEDEIISVSAVEKALQETSAVEVEGDGGGEEETK
eukprot:TRINITY_DN546_c0_g1_i6.p1 TRINITY_DN546_c0_g1~~TRINITY_DN546_c0_g1_i6.p1  ORF type:complete len:198 (-),score=38.66 TRINITY_DN546_c0_g1_i6:151-744(-)